MRLEATDVNRYEDDKPHQGPNSLDYGSSNDMHDMEPKIPQDETLQSGD